MIKTIIGLSLLFLLQGCNSTTAGKVVRIDPREIKDTDANYGSEDLHIFTKSMIQSMLRTKILNVSKVSLALNEIQIASGLDEHIDTKLIQNTLRTHLIRTSKVDFIDHEHRAKIKKEIQVDYLLGGDIHAIKKDTLSSIDNFYVLSLRLTNSKTSDIVWTEEKEIRKIVTK